MATVNNWSTRFGPEPEPERHMQSVPIRLFVDAVP